MGNSDNFLGRPIAENTLKVISDVNFNKPLDEVSEEIQRRKNQNKNSSSK